VPRITKVVTRSGDDGHTALGSGRRVPKSSPRVAAYGTVDELNAQLGVALSAGLATELLPSLRQIQNDLFHLGAELCLPPDDLAARPGPRIEPRHLATLDDLIATLNAQLPPLQNFVLPGGHPAAAALHVARTVCRRAEREVVALHQQEPVGPHVIPYLNRLSDALFVLARTQNRLAGVPEPTWNSHA